MVWLTYACTKFMHDHPMIYYWARYEGFRVGAILLLPQCNIKLVQRLNGARSQNVHSFWAVWR